MASQYDKGFSVMFPGDSGETLDVSPNLSIEDEMQNVEKRDKSFLRIGRTPSEPTFLRFGRSPSQTFLRIGRAGPVKTFLRIGRSGFLRIGRGLDRKYIRLGRSVLHAGEDEQGQELTPEQIQFLMENKERLLQLLQPSQNKQASSEFEDDGSYFAFPRQGRAMSFYFPRMGRSGDNNLEDSMLCCSGVRSILTTEKAIDICSPDQACCSGLNQKTKLYKNVVITECSEDSLDKIRAYIGED
ncbi:FLP01-like protein [Mya arenaria]|uniref:FLP01-like protein n=1 Tax=Mya arenaria TaxID=6604 RepID=A0ABY7F0E3_MYAAR|nr:FLP01-like protein [Mya arenaria]